MPGLPDYLAVKQASVAALRTKLSAAETPGVPVSVRARVAGSSGVRPVQVREFTIVTDSLPALAGHNLGPTAPELLLSALASCLAHTYLVVATNHSVRYETLEVEVRGCIDYRGLLEVDPAAPIAPYDLAYDAQIATDATDAMLARVQADVERLCPVLRALTQPTPVTGRVVRTGAAVAAG